jgi:polar amino acid transport system substrate-binding protein
MIVRKIFTFILFFTTALFAIEVQTSKTILPLTDTQKSYLEKKKVIKMCIDPDWMPYEKFDKKGHYVGMTAEYFTIFQKKLDIPIVPVHTKTWSESIEAAKSRKCDIYSLAMATPERKTYMNFTSPYLSIPLILATKLDVPFMDDLHFLKKKKVGIVKGYAFNEIIRREYPNIEVVDVENLEDGLQKVANGELFGFVGTMASVGYMFQTHFMGELKIAGKFKEKWELGIGARNDEPILLDIFENAIQNISPQTQQRIFSKYIAIKYEKRTDYMLIMKILLVVLLIVLFGMYHYRKLHKINKELECLKNKLQEQADHDPLTQLYNRRYFHNIAEDMKALSIREKKPMSIIMIDIDFFKKVNDTYGHIIGDKVLIMLSSILKKHTRKSDIVARFGGEEFVILLPDTNLAGALEIAQKLRMLVAKEIISVEGNTSFSITISLGATEVLENDRNVDSAIDRADKALYKAKENGRNCVMTYEI